MLEIRDVQAIKYLKAELRDQGGVIVTRGDHGAGKTTSISCVAALSNTETRQRLRPRDGCEAGTITAPGVVVRIGRKNTARGELTWEMLDADCDPSILVEPGLKDRVLADAHRLRLLVSLGSVEIFPSDWAQLLDAGLDPDQVESIVAKTDVANPIGSAEVVRFAVHNQALANEKAAERYSAQAATLEAEIAGVEFGAESDAAALQARYDAAVQEHARLDSERRACESATATYDLSVGKLRAVEGSLPDLESIRLSISGHESVRACEQSEVIKIDQQIAELQRRRADAKRRIDEATKASADATTRLRAAEVQHASVASLRQIVDAGRPTGPTAEQVLAAQVAKHEANAAMLAGYKIRQAQDIQKRAKASIAAAAAAERESKALRELARSTDQVLERALLSAGFHGLSWRSGRLYVESDRGLEGKWELFDDLSEGERYQWAFRWVSQKLPPSSLLPLSQEAWQGLSPRSRADIARLSREHSIWLWTGEIGDGELRAVTYPTGEEG